MNGMNRGDGVLFLSMKTTNYSVYFKGADDIIRSLSIFSHYHILAESSYCTNIGMENIIELKVHFSCQNGL